MKILGNYNFIGFSSDSESFKKLKPNEFEIPISNHVGAFGTERKNHKHEGIDLYCDDGTEVYSLTAGLVIDSGKFTGFEESPWWNDTYHISILYNNKDINKVIVYGEISKSELKKGTIIKKGDLIGSVKQVLKVDKSRPMSMLHIEHYLYSDYRKPKEWKDSKPIGLISPLELFNDLFDEVYPDKETYELMYAKYIEKNFKFDDYFKLDYQNKKVLDLCGGAGYTSLEMIKRGAIVDYFDLSNTMISKEVLYNSKITKYYGDIRSSMLFKKYDVVITKQAINYWFEDININIINNLLEDNGIFMFNTFYMDKNEIVKEYEIDGNKYKEISQLENDMVYHTQICNGAIHRTIFKNISEKMFMDKLSTIFKNIEVVKKNNSYYYLCQK